MPKAVTKAIDNAYYKARISASKYNNKFSSREAASEELGWSKESLTQYELNFCRVVPPEKVVIMSDVYDAPELLNHYCQNECPIGEKKGMKPVDFDNIDNLFKFAVLTSNALDQSEEIKKILFKIVADGVIDESEINDLNNIVDFFEDLETRALEIKVLAQRVLKNMKK